MSDFNQADLEAWVELCNQEGEMRRNGASEADLALMNARVTMAMALLLPNISDEERAGLILFLLRASPVIAEPDEVVTPPAAEQDPVGD
jgi:hypothetical protein